MVLFINYVTSFLHSRALLTRLNVKNVYDYVHYSVVCVVYTSVLPGT